MKKFTKMLVLALAMVMMFGAGNVAEAAKAKVTSVKVTKVGDTKVKKGKVTINRGEENVKAPLTVTVKVKNGASQEVTYKSSNKKVASVSKDGVLTAKKAGKATITVTSKANKKKKATVVVTVKQDVTAIKASVKKPIASFNNVVSLRKGKTYTLNATVAPKNASNKKVTYKSSNKKIAKVTVKNGVAKVKAVKPGTAVITVKSVSNKDVVAKLNIVVTKKITTKVSSVTLAAEKSVIKTGEKTTVKATVAPEKATLATVAFKSSDEKIATVDAVTGEVTAVAAGTVTITAKAIDGSKKSATVEIKVIDPKTIIAPKASVEIEATVEFTKSADLKADMDAYIKAAKIADGTKLDVTVDGEAKTAEVVKGSVMINGKSVADLTGTKVTLKAKVNAQKYFAALAFTPKSVTKVTVGKAIFTEITEKSFKLNDVEYTYVVDGKTVVIDGDYVTAMTELFSAYADVKANEYK